MIDRSRRNFLKTSAGAAGLLYIVGTSADSLRVVCRSVRASSWQA
jgi:hypothetical protein